MRDEFKIKEIEEGLRKKYFVKGDETRSIQGFMRDENVPGMSIAVIKDFEISWMKEYGVNSIVDGVKVNKNTIFQAASLSKPVTALAVMKLVQDGKVDLDENVNTYLRSWKLEENELTKDDKVTLRNLLSHTAGISVSGFPGYSYKEKIPTILKILNGEEGANTGKIEVKNNPNREYSYSGGGYTIVQQLMVDLLNKPFQEIMKEYVLEPLGMNNSFFSNEILDKEKNENITAAHDDDGAVIEGERHVYPEMAAAGLWTTSEDMAKFAVEIQKSLKGESNKIISKEVAEEMITPILNGEYNIGFENLSMKDEKLLAHGGSNEGYKCGMMFHREKGYGIVFMTNGDRGYQVRLELYRSFAKAYGYDELIEERDISDDAQKKI